MRTCFGDSLGRHEARPPLATALRWCDNRAIIGASPSSSRRPAMSMRKHLLAFICLISGGVLSAQPDRKSPSSQSLTDSIGVPLPAGAIARLGGTRFRRGGGGAMAISPDSSTLVTTAESGNIRFWDIATGKLLHEVREDKRRFTSALYSPDGNWFV